MNLLSQAGITLNPHDRVLLNGLPILLDQPITNYPITLQIRRAVRITIITPNGEQNCTRQHLPSVKPYWTPRCGYAQEIDLHHWRSLGRSWDSAYWPELQPSIRE